MNAITLNEASEFIWGEGALLDRLAYREWLPLWTATGLYVIPTRHDADEDPVDSLNIVYDDAGMRQARVQRLLSGFSMSSAPPARTVRSASRFVIADVDEGAIRLDCAQTIVEYKYERTRLLAGNVRYHLIRTGEGLRIQEKTVRLIDADDALFGIGYLL